MMGGTSRVVCTRGGGDDSGGCRDDMSFEGVSEGVDGYKC
jgi:hypothetical protein